MDNKLGLVIPTLNEEANIGIVIDRARQNLDRLPLNYELLIVDDDSSDGTRRVVEDRQRSDSRIRLLVRTDARGLSGAVILGWQQTNANLLGVMDADLQHPPELLPALLSPVLSGKDIAIASRYISAEGTLGWNQLRRGASRIATWMTEPLQKRGIRVHDPLSGFFVLYRHCIENIQLQPEGFKLLLEILVRGSIRSVAEVPYHFGLRHAGKSKANWRVGYDYVHLVGRLFRDTHLRPGHP